MSTIKRQLKPVPFTQVTFDDGFWAPRLELNRTVTIPHIYHQLETTGRISAFDLNFQRPVPSPIVLIFGDSDLAKWIEEIGRAHSELQSRLHLVCRLLLEKKKK